MSDIGWPTVVTVCTSTKHYVNALLVQCLVYHGKGYHLRNPSPSIDFHEVLEFIRLNLSSTYKPHNSHLFYLIAFGVISSS